MKSHKRKEKWGSTEEESAEWRDEAKTGVHFPTSLYWKVTYYKVGTHGSSSMINPKFNFFFHFQH